MSSPTPPRALHWVLKIGNLQTSLHFFENVLGLRVLRHEEFSSGCEATCNGPYGGAWSKTMMGYGPEDTSFALELTYNYGIDSYAFGNDLQFIALQNPAALHRAKALGYEVRGDMILGPDSYRYKIVPAIPGRAELFVCVSLLVSDLVRSQAFWSGVLGMTPVRCDLEGCCSEGSENVSLAYGDDQTCLHLVKVKDGVSVDHALSGGRIAFGCSSVSEMYSKAAQADAVVQTAPLVLSTPGKCDVVVTILVDPDGYEICFVEDIAFYELAAPTYDVVDFAERASRGGDGVGITRGRQRSAAAPPSDAHTGHGGPVGFDGAVIVINSEDHFNSFLFPSSPQDIAPGVVIAEFGASWCKNCRKIAPVIKNLAMQHKFTALVLDVDIDDCEDVATTCQVSSVPRLIAYRGGVKVGDYTGSNPDEVTAFFNEHTRDGDQE